ncbi:MAG TPA: PIN domain-containing protein [Gemmataceae bacterium]|nr:PIN domain-containing protein [Gemmataceae bacterium]
MSLYVFDTDAFSLYQNCHPVVIQNIARHIGHQFALTVTTADELVSGWQARLRRARTDAQIVQAQGRLAEVLELMSGWPILPMTLPALARFEVLIKAKLRTRANDLRITAVALEAGGVVVTRNLRDFRRVPGLVVEDWSV